MVVGGGASAVQHLGEIEEPFRPWRPGDEDDDGPDFGPDEDDDGPGYAHDVDGSDARRADETDAQLDADDQPEPTEDKAA